jgi:hypothetical protein
VEQHHIHLFGCPKVSDCDDEQRYPENDGEYPKEDECAGPEEAGVVLCFARTPEALPWSAKVLLPKPFITATGTTSQPRVVESALRHMS